MLDRLPNEILHKIFNKTKLKTAKSCRLLNRRCDTLITEYRFIKDNLKDFRIHPSKFCMGRVNSVTVDMRINKNKRITSDNFEAMLDSLPHYLNKIERVEHFSLILVPINDKLLDMLSQQEFLRYIRILGIEGCTNEVKDQRKWFSFLEKLQLEQFNISTVLEEQFFTLPSTILDHVSTKILVQSSEANVLTEHPWITDTVVRKWFRAAPKKIQRKTLINKKVIPKKSLTLYRIVTGMTVHGLIACIKMMLKRKSKNGHIQNFGILNNTTPELVEQALTESRLRWTALLTDNPVYHDPVAHFRVTSKDGRRVFDFGCVNPGRVYAHPPIGLYELFAGLIGH